MAVLSSVVDVVLGFLKMVVFVYDIATFPIYYLTQPSLKERTKQNLGPVKCTVADGKVVGYFREMGRSRIYQEIVVRNKIDTMVKAFEYSVRKFGDRECLGTRRVLGEEDEVQASGKMFKKLSLGDYEWMTYNMVHASAMSFGAGLRVLGQQPGSPIAIYAETRAEWMVCCLGAFSQNVPVATVYTNLGDDSVAEALNQVGASIVITSHELLPRFRNGILSKLHEVKTIIVMEDQLHPTDLQGYEGSEIVPFRRVVVEGASLLAKDVGSIQTVPPTPEDTAIIMYTSGSTGKPKGVMLSHKNLIATMKCLMFMVEPKEDDIYIAFLPLAHVLELLSENTMMLFGVKVGYSSPNTMTDMSTKVRKGCKGDASVLHPTLMCAVPLILDRIYKNILESVKKKGPVFQKVFQVFYDYKSYWSKRGHTTPLVDKIVFNKIRGLLGGGLNFMIVGGAPLSGDTHDFIRICLGAILVQGYSLTESCCSGTVMENSDLSTGGVGRPMTGVKVQLVDWDEGNYRVTDLPKPRGEIILGGDTVAKGYFGDEEKTGQEFFEAGGCRWVRTGDIGEFDKNGTLKVIDRKKDLVKLQLGEYVSLGKVEAVMKTHPLTENICVFGDPYRTFIVALVVPSKTHLESLASQLGKTASYEKLLNDPDVESGVLEALKCHGLRGLLAKFELPHAVTLVSEQWTPESGLITASFKMKRNVLQNYYQRDIDRMYSQVHL